MSDAIRDAFSTLIVTAAVPVALAAHDPQAHQHPATRPEGGAHRHPSAAQLRNPVPADNSSIAAGRQISTRSAPAATATPAKATARWARR